VSCAVDALSFVFDDETQATEFKDSGVVLRDAECENIGERNTAAFRVDEQTQDRRALGLRLWRLNLQ